MFIVYFNEDFLGMIGLCYIQIVLYKLIIVKNVIIFFFFFIYMRYFFFQVGFIFFYLVVESGYKELVGFLVVSYKVSVDVFILVRVCVLLFFIIFSLFIMYEFRLIRVFCLQEKKIVLYLVVEKGWLQVCEYFLELRVDISVLDNVSVF